MLALNEIVTFHLLICILEAHCLSLVPNCYYFFGSLILGPLSNIHLIPKRMKQGKAKFKPYAVEMHLSPLSGINMMGLMRYGSVPFSECYKQSFVLT